MAPAGARWREICRAAARFAAALRRLARRARRRAAHPRLPRGPRTSAGPRCSTPDTAHGTNPATVTMAGYEVVKVGTDAHGNVDLDDLRAKADEDVACLMLTNPSTLGLFETGIEEIARIVHDVGATLYYDGANLNAIMGISPPGRHGLRHRPLQPAQVVHPAPRRRRTGAGPIAVSERIEPYLPRPQVVRRQPRRRTAPSRFYDLDYDRPSRSGACAASRATTACSCAPTRTSARSARAGLREASESRRAERQLPAGRLRARASSSTCRTPTTASACTSSSSPAAPMKHELGHQDARPRQAPARLRRAPADRVLPADRRRGADGRADRDRDQGDARPVRRGGRGDPRARRARIRRSLATPRTRRPVRRPRRGGRGAAPGRPTGDVGHYAFRRLRRRRDRGVRRSCLHQAGHEVALIARGAPRPGHPRARLTFERPGAAGHAERPRPRITLRHRLAARRASSCWPPRARTPPARSPRCTPPRPPRRRWCASRSRRERAAGLRLLPARVRRW